MNRSIDVQERQHAFTSLLADPSISRETHPHLWATVRKHRPILTEWFTERLGYRLVVADNAARLYRLPVGGTVLAPARVRAPSRRVLVLALLAAASAEDADDLTTVQELSDRVRTLSSRDEVPVADYNPDRFAERQLFIRAIEILVSFGALRPTRRTGEEMLSGWARHADAIGGAYRVSREMLLRMIDPQCLSAAVGRRSAADHDDPRQRRFTVMRRLIELPVCMIEDLNESEVAYMSSQRHRLLEWCREMTGWAVEQRREGIALVPSQETATDRPFPRVKADHFGTLLILDQLLALPHGVADLATVHGAANQVRERYPRALTNAYREDPAQLADVTVTLLTELDLIRPLDPGQWRLMPASARFRGPRVLMTQQRLGEELEDHENMRDTDRGEWR